MDAKDIPIPEAWQKVVKRAMIHTVALARYALVTTYSWAENHHRKDLNRACPKNDK